MLVTCPDCNHRVSDAAAACPGCGRPIRPGVGDLALEHGRAAAKRWRALQIDPVFCFLLLLAAFVFYGLTVYLAPESKGYVSPEDRPSETPSIVMGICGTVSLLLSLRGYALRPGTLLNRCVSRFVRER